MIKKRIAQTDIEVSCIGLGTVKFGRNSSVKYPAAFDLPDDNAILNCLSVANELGINLLDTAPAYGVSEQRLGKLLQGQRHNYVLCSKAGEEFDGTQSSYHFQRKDIINSVERSLKHLQTDYLDILLIHSNGDDVNIIENYAVFDTLADLKQRGLIRAYGMSTKTVEGGLLTLQHADIAMVAYNPIYTEEQEVITNAAENHKSIFVKKAFASGHLNQLQEYAQQRDMSVVDATFDFIFQQAGISSVIIGSLNPKHITENVHAALRALTNQHL